MVRECITSILGLSLSPDEREIIVIDDGSDSPLIDSLGGLAGHIIYIRQDNSGLSASRNNGIAASTGRYIQFVDGDDRLIKDGYERCLDIVRAENPDIVLFNNTADRRRLCAPKVTECVSGTHFMLYNSLHAAAWGYIFKRDILGSLRFTTGIYHEDEEFTPLLMLRAGRLYDTKLTAYYYRQRHGSIMNAVSENVIKKRIDDMEYVIRSLKDKSTAIGPPGKDALERRIAQLTVAYIYQIIKLTHSASQLEERLDWLREHGFFPLPDNRYNWKYTLFRTLSGNKVSRKLLLFAIR